MMIRFVFAIGLAIALSSCGEAKPARENGGKPTDIPKGAGLITGEDGQWYILRQSTPEAPQSEATQ